MTAFLSQSELKRFEKNCVNSIMQRLSYILTPGSKLNSKLVYIPQEKLLYVKNVTNSDNTVTYICKDCKSVPWKCTARIVLIDQQYCSYTNQSKPHVGHGNHEEIYKKNYIYDKFKRRALDIAEICGWQSEKIAIQPILNNVLGSLPTELQNVRLDNKYLVQYLNKLKRKTFPKSPKSVDEIIAAFNEQDTNRLYGKYYIHTQSSIPKKRYAFTMLCDKHILPVVGEIENREILLDGTFEIVRRGPYQQLLIIYIVYRNEIYPLFYVFMESRCTASYQQVFDYIEKNLLELQPNTIHSDYEASLIKSLHLIYPNAKHVGCWFHYCQAVRRKLGRNKGTQFFTHLKEDKSAYKTYKKLLDLPLLPANKIAEGFQIIKQEIEDNKSEEYFKHIYSYFEAYWIPKAQIISVYKQEHRTTSALESFNANISMITPSKFNFFKILTRLEEYIKDTSQKFVNAIHGPFEPPKKRSKKKQYNYENIQFCTDQFEKNNFDVAKFLEFVVQDNRQRMSVLERSNLTNAEEEDIDEGDSENDQSSIDNLYCVLCKTRISNILFLPCRHVVLCSNCYIDVNTKCQFCDCLIEQIINIASR